MTCFIPDISNNDGAGLSMADFAAEGFAGLFAKVTQGSDFQDETWPAYRDAALAAGLQVAGYHYADTSDPTAQVANYQQWVGDPGIAVMIDFEDDSGDITNYWALVAAFNAVGLRVTLSYLPQWYWQQIGSPDLSLVPGLIASSYPGGTGYASDLYTAGGGDSGPGWNPYGGATPVIWQFTDQASIAGNTLDANAFRGTPADLAALLGGDMTPEQAAQLTDIQTQLRGPDLTGWPQLGKNAAGQDCTLVDGVAALITQLAALQAAITKGAA